MRANLIIRQGDTVSMSMRRETVQEEVEGVVFDKEVGVSIVTVNGVPFRVIEHEGETMLLVVERK